MRPPYRQPLPHVLLVQPRRGAGIEPGVSTPGTSRPNSLEPRRGAGRLRRSKDRLRPFGAIGEREDVYLGLKPQALCPRPSGAERARCVEEGGLKLEVPRATPRRRDTSSHPPGYRYIAATYAYVDASYRYIDATCPCGLLASRSMNPSRQYSAQDRAELQQNLETSARHCLETPQHGAMLRSCSGIRRRVAENCRIVSMCRCNSIVRRGNFCGFYVLLGPSCIVVSVACAIVGPCRASFSLFCAISWMIKAADASNAPFFINRELRESLAPQAGRVSRQR